MAKGKKGKKGKKGAARVKAAKKAARTRARLKAERSKAAKKAARSRARKKGGRGKGKSARSKAAKKAARTRARNKKMGARESMAAEKKKGGKKGRKGSKGSKGKKGRKKSRRHPDVAAQIAKNKAMMADLQSRYAKKLDDAKLRIAKAEGAEKQRLIKKLEKLLQERDRELARVDRANQRNLEKERELAAAEERKKHRSKGKSGAREPNPIGSSDKMEHLAAGAGVLTAIALVIVPYRLTRSHALQAGMDAPVQGDVPNLLTAQLPVWSRLKSWRTLGLVGIVAGNVALPLGLAAWSDNPNWKSYFQLWGWSSVGLIGTKLVVDTMAFALKGTSLGQRLFAPENTARDVRAQSAATQLPPIAVAPGSGLPGLTGYGKPEEERQHGAGCACSGCKRPKNGMQTQPPAATTPPSTAPGVTAPPAGPPANAVTPTGAAGAPKDAPAPEQKTNIIHGRFQRPEPTPGRFAGRRR